MLFENFVGLLPFFSLLIVIVIVCFNSTIFSPLAQIHGQRIVPNIDHLNKQFYYDTLHQNADIKNRSDEAFIFPH